MIDDAPLVRSRFVAMLRGVPGVARVVEASGVKEAVPALEAYRPGIVILDVNMPGGSGIAFVPRVKRDCPDALLVLVSNEANEPYRKRSTDAGADVLLDKSRDFDAVVRLVAAAVARAPTADRHG